MNFAKLKELKIKNYLDVGTNLGQFYGGIKKQIPEIYTEFIEPNTACTSRLQKNFPDIKIHQYAISDVNKKNRTLFINKFKRFSKGASLVQHTGEYQELSVDTKTLDTLLKDQKFDLIKIDVEGLEEKVIDGAKNTISKAKYLLIEMEYNLSLLNKLKKQNFIPIDVLEQHIDKSKKKVTKIDILFSNIPNDIEIAVEKYYE